MEKPQGRSSGAAKGAVKDPVCGMLLGPTGVVVALNHGGTLHSFCSEKCAQAFLQRPDAFAGPASQAVTDPVCGMRYRLLDAPFHRVHGGITYHFCSQECYDRFSLDPGGFVNPSEVM